VCQKKIRPPVAAPQASGALDHRWPDVCAGYHIARPQVYLLSNLGNLPTGVATHCFPLVIPSTCPVPSVIPSHKAHLVNGTGSRYP
jgi:hypothetical protein